MRILRTTHRDLERLPGRRAVTLGTFDGVHRGHQAVFAELRRAASAAGLEGACAVTFGPHPREVLSPDQVPPLLNSRGDRERMLAACGLDLLVVLDFTPDLAALPYEEFVAELLVGRLGLVHFVLGHDVHFGHGRGGNAHTVAELGDQAGFVVSQVPSVVVRGEPVSSTRIRQSLIAGDLDLATELLGHPHLLSGTVLRGRQLGRTIGFATANLELPARRVLPALGVYAGWARWEGDTWQAAVVNVGRAPTVTTEGRPRVEVHVLDRELDLYERHLEVALAARIRPERTFPGLDALRRAIEADVEVARRALARAGRFARPGRLDDLTGPDLA